MGRVHGAKCGADDGQAMLMLIPIVAGLVAFSLAFLLPLGDASNRRTQTSAAADAAALAAAEAWRTDVVSVFEGAVRAPGEGQALGLLRQLLGTSVVDFGGNAEQQARLFADRNEATVLGVDVRPTAGGMEYRVRTRSQQTVAETTQYTYGEATARVELRGGLCLRGGGRSLGLVLAGVCQAALPEVALPEVPLLPPLLEGLPVDLPEVEVPALPVGPPEDLGRLDVRVRLVD